ncbi:MAG TPA: NAD(P)-dependent oxidoreductase [Chloroflexota bacterium]|nr:NAD(P)-dependent oxidoreductase [Chloroflexota bacterium]
MAVLVTGVGYIGAALAARLLRAGERVVALDNGFATDLTAVAGLAELGDFELVRGSVTAPRAVARAFARGPFAVVYHLAAQASSAAAAERPRYTETTNLTGPRVILDAAVRHGVPRVVYGSSFRVYGPVLPPAVDEQMPYGPQGDLAHLSHVYGEKLLELYARRHQLTAIAVRLAVVHGLGPVMKTDYRYLTVPNKYCLQAVRGEPLVVYPGAAAPTAFIHLDDACAALQAAAAVAWPPGFHAANAAGEVCPVPQVAALVATAAQARGLPTRSPQNWRAGGAIHSRLTALGWRPTRTLAASVGAVLDYYRAREPT